MLHDAYGNSLGTKSPEARDAYDLGVHRFLGAEPGVADSFEAAINADYGFALAHIGLTREMQLRARPDRVKASLARARSLSDGLSERERSHIDAAGLLLEGKSAAAKFVQGIQATGSTRHLQALKLALGLRPDVVFFLTDADEPQLSVDELRKVQHWNQATAINAIEFGFGPQSRRENFLVQLARQNGGQHVYVDTSLFRRR